MEITQISSQKAKDRFNIFIDGEFSFGCSAEMLVRFGLHKGKKISPNELEELKAINDQEKVFKKALSYVSRRLHGRKELEDKLLRKGIDQTLVYEAIKKLEDYGYIDDKKFAAAWVRDRKLLNPRGKRLLYLELKKKKVDEELIKQALEEVSAEGKIEEAANLLRKKYKTYIKDEKNKAMNFLARRGYDYGTIKEAWEEFEK